MSFAVDMKSLVVAGGISASSVLTSLAAKIPNKGTIISIIEYPGLEPYRIHNIGIAPALERPKAQVLVRAENTDIAKSTARTVLDSLMISNTTINGIKYLWVKSTGTSFELPPDFEGRSKVAFNIEALKQPS